MRACFGLSALWLLLAVTASGTDIYVDNVNGDDRRSGQSPDSSGLSGGPVRTISKALRLANKGDLISLADTGVPYRECIAVQGGFHSHTGPIAFEIHGNGAVLDGSLPILASAWEHVKGDIFRYQPRRGAYQQLFLRGAPAARKPVAGSTMPELQPLEWCLYGGQIYFRVEPGVAPYAYEASCAAHPVGITAYDVDGVIIRDLKIRGFQLDGFQAHDNVRRFSLLNVTSEYNGRAGFAIANSSKVALSQCSAQGNGEAQVYCEGVSLTTLIGGQFNSASAPEIVRLEGARLEREAAE